MHEALRKNLDKAQIEAYLERIGLPKEAKKPSVEYLDEIIKAQLRHIPFDDADVWAFKAFPSLATDDLFNKIIINKRGGYCFELNGLFNTFLRSLGFDCYEVIVHLARPELNGELNYPAHCAVVIIIDGLKRFADVGYGGPVPDGSVPFTGELVNGHKQYMNGVYTVVGNQTEDGGFYGRFTFKDCPCDPTEIVPINFHVSQRPGSVFAADLKLNIRRDDGYGEVGNQIFKWKDANQSIEKQIKSPAEAAEIALEYFGIPDLPVREF